jgi:hypothetical protein
MARSHVTKVPRKPKPNRCKSCGDFGEFTQFCSEECRETGKDLMPEQILDLLAEREEKRARGELPRMKLKDEEILGWKKHSDAQRFITDQGMSSVASAASEFKRGGW